MIFGQSNEVGAISFYLREGALFSTDVIGKYSRRNSPEDNISFFKEFITNKRFLQYRYPEGPGISFVYIQNKQLKKEFQERSFKAREEFF